MRKKRNLILLSVLLITLCAFIGTLIYAIILNQPGSAVKPPVTEEGNNSPADIPEGTPSAVQPVHMDPPISEESTPTEENSKNDVTETIPDEIITKDPIVLAFAGDINLNDTSKTIARYDREQKGIFGALSPELIDEMNAADIMMVNNEFAFSTRGKAANKSYTFRSDPKRVEILKEMGVDIVSLANNHTLDFGVDALMDTFETLDNAEIQYVGAGINMDRAKSAIYFTVGNTKIAYLAASRVVFAMDWYATENRPGMIGTYDPTLFLEAIKEASLNSDYVVTYLHWGVENKHYPENYQKNLAKQYIDAGADVVIGCHPHVMQGFEFYKGKPIAYSLGNYWFNSLRRESGLLKLYLHSDGSMRLQILPAMTDNAFTYIIVDEKEKKEYFDFIRRLSFEVNIDEEGFISPKQ